MTQIKWSKSDCNEENDRASLGKMKEWNEMYDEVRQMVIFHKSKMQKKILKIYIIDGSFFF